MDTKKPLLPVSSSLLSSGNVPEVGMLAKSLQIQYRNMLEVLTVVFFLPNLVP